MKQIPLNGDLFALVDDSDFERVNQHKWCTSGGGGTQYAHRRVGKGFVRLHRFILGDCAGFVVDHIDGNGLNNQRSNLRLCSRGQNCQNAKTQGKRLSRFKGVTVDKRQPVRRYRARIRFQYKLICLGYFEHETDAAEAYDRAARDLFGAFARLNFPGVEA